MTRTMGRRLSLLGATAGLSLAFAAPAAAEKHIVLYKASAVPADGQRSIEAAGGRVVAAYDEIGVVIADSDSPTFAQKLRRDAKVDGAAPTSRFAVRLEPEPASHDGQPSELPNAPATPDSLSALQWDMRQINAPQANAITGGSPAVVTGIIDTGVDKDHPDLRQNLDLARSASCESGAPVQSPAAWDDRHGHGTHTAGTVGAADNGFGITGVAPNARLAAIKSSTDAGFFLPEMVVCSFVWAGQQRLDVTNNSYYADPFLFNCRNDPVQRAIWKAEQRAIKYAQSRGVTVVAAMGNNSDDLAHPTYDASSPDYPPGNEEEREITNACVTVPVEVSGVIGVSATGPDRQKSFYSNYGVGVTDLAAPGGDSSRPTLEAPNGRVLSTYPGELPCTRQVTEPSPAEPNTLYCYLQGTSMASPHVAGVAALVISRFGDLQNPQNGKMRPGQVAQYLEQTANPRPCPEDYAFYAPFPRPDGSPQECQGGPGYNAWYGRGEVDALRAVTHDTSD